MNMPPHAPLYQYQSAEVPKKPPDTPVVVAKPEQIVVFVAVTEFAEIELSFTVIILWTHSVVLQIPSALT